MSASVAVDGSSPGSRLDNAGTNRASSGPHDSTCAASCSSGAWVTKWPEGFGEQLVRGGEVFLAVPEQHTGALVERDPGRLGEQRGLAETGLARHQEHLPALTRGDPLERIQRRPPARRRGPTTPTAGRTARRAGSGTTGPRLVDAERLPQHLDRLDRIGQALQGERAERPAVVAAAAPGRQPDDVGRQHLPARTAGAQPRRLDDRLTEVVVVLAGSPRRRSAPTRNPTGCSRRRLSRSMPCCIATAHDNAADADRNTTISPSPRFFTSVPPASTTAWRNIAKCPRRSSSAASGARLDARRGRAHHVGEQHRPKVPSRTGSPAERWQRPLRWEVGYAALRASITPCQRSGSLL